MECISKQILLEEDLTQLFIWQTQDRRRHFKRKKKAIKKLIYTLLKVMSKVAPRFRGKIIKGVMQFDRKEDYLNYIQNLEGKEVSLVIKEWEKNRSNQENSYYWSVPIELISKHTGYSDEEVHELLKSLFLKKKIDVKTKEGITERHTIVRSTSTLTTVEFEEYLSKIRQWASQELSVYVPEPHECDY